QPGRVRPGGSALQGTVHGVEGLVRLQEEVTRHPHVAQYPVLHLDVHHDQLAAGNLVLTVHDCRLPLRPRPARRARPSPSTRDAGALFPVTLTAPGAGVAVTPAPLRPRAGGATPVRQAWSSRSSSAGRSVTSSCRGAASGSSKAHRWAGAQPNALSNSVGRESSALCAESHTSASPHRSAAGSVIHWPARRPGKGNSG